mgnify:CR=1 FL=1
MTPRTLLWAAWSGTAIVAVVSAIAWATTPPPARRLSARSIAAAELSTPPAPDSSRSATSVLQSRNPFRLDRKPTAVRYNPWQPAPPPAAVNLPAPKPPKPILSLAGILGGPPWSALIEGLPGREGGVLIDVGEQRDGFRVIAVIGDTVFVVGADTSWALTPRRPWR